MKRFISIATFLTVAFCVLAAFIITIFFSSSENIVVQAFHFSAATLFFLLLVLLGYFYKAKKELSETNEMFIKLNDAAQDGIVLINNAGKVKMWNPSSERIFGYQRDEILGKELHTILAPEKYYGDYKKGFASFRKTGTGNAVGKTLELFALRKNGEEFPIELSLTSVSLRGKWCALGIIRDITDRKRVESEIKKTQERLEFILGYTNTGFDIIDEELNMIYIDPTWGRIYGNHEGKKCYKYFMGKDAPCEGCGVMKALKTGQKVITEELLIKENNRPVEVITLPFKDTDGRWYAAEINIDITERKKTQAELDRYGKHLEELVEQKTSDLARREKIMQSLMEDLNTSKELIQKEKDELARSNKELEEFAYVASHDLQEPLRMVASYVGLLEKRYKNVLDGDANEYIEFAVDGAKRMQTLIKDLLEYSRVGTRGKPFTEVSCDEIMKEVREMLKVSLDNSHAQLIWNKLPKIKADALQMSQVFQNLIANAIKFRSKEAPKIHIECKEDYKFWNFAVRDNGIGFDPRFADRIFGLFTRLHGKKEYKGTGIGLAICKKVIERHGGRIWAESEPGKGSAFHFTVPKNPDEGNL